MARPRHRATTQNRKIAKTLAAMGVDADGIAGVIGVSENTARKYYGRELEVGLLKANAAVAQALFRQATGRGPGAAQAAMFWLRFCPSPMQAAWQLPARTIARISGGQDGQINVVVAG